MTFLRFVFAFTIFLVGLMLLAMMCVILAPSVLAHQPAPFPLWFVWVAAGITALEGGFALQAALALAKKARA